jgi:hypothetical protein
VVGAVDALQTVFRAPLTPGVHPGGQNIAYDLALIKLGPHTKFLFCPATRAPSASFK